MIRPLRVNDEFGKPVERKYCDYCEEVLVINKQLEQALDEIEKDGIGNSGNFEIGDCECDSCKTKIAIAKQAREL